MRWGLAGLIVSSLGSLALAQDDAPTASEDTPTYTITYTIQSGDTITKIARLYGISEESIRYENRIFGPSLIAGRTLTITIVDTFPDYSIPIPMPEPQVVFLPEPKPQIYQQGWASWYGPRFQGRRTASGTRYNMYAYTAAHRQLSFGTRVKVTNTRNSRSVVVVITDRGPYKYGRIIDLSYSAARALGMDGLAEVTLEILEP